MAYKTLTDYLPQEVQQQSEGISLDKVLRKIQNILDQTQVTHGSEED